MSDTIKKVDALLFAFGTTSGLWISLQEITAFAQGLAAICGAVLGVVGVVRLFRKKTR